MILVSFSSAEDVWSNDVNKYNTFSSQGTENSPFRFFWDTRYNCSSRHTLVSTGRNYAIYVEKLVYFEIQ